MKKGHLFREGFVMILYMVCISLSSGLIFSNQRVVDQYSDKKEKNQIGEVSETAADPERQKEAPVIAITFDDGPSSSYTPMLLDGLKERGVKATFFLIGKNAQEHPEIVRRLKEEGHLIGNHTYHHVCLTELSEEAAREEIDLTNQVLEEIIGEGTEFVRPPFGEWNRGMEEKTGVLSVMWSVDPLDWTTGNTEEIINRVVTDTEENDIILLHDCYKSSVEAALRIIDILQGEGYEFVTVDKLLID